MFTSSQSFDFYHGEPVIIADQYIDELVGRLSKAVKVVID